MTIRQYALLPRLACLALLIFSLASFSLPVKAIDNSAKNDFKSSVNNTGGSEASNVPELVKNIINILLYVSGVIAVIIIVISSIRFVTSEGDSAAATKARNSVVYALVGLVLAVMAYAIVNFVLESITT